MRLRRRGGRSTRVDLDARRRARPSRCSGRAGAGKTTLLRAVAGLQPLDAGRVAWNGDDLARVAPHERRFGLMFQEYALFPHRDVAGNVEFGLRMAATDRAATRRRGSTRCSSSSGWRGSRDRRVATLSGGEQQRVALARALGGVAAAADARRAARRARPGRGAARLLAEIRAILDAAALPALYVTHDHEEAFAIARPRRDDARRAGSCRSARRPTCGGTRPTRGPRRSSVSVRSSPPRSRDGRVRHAVGADRSRGRATRAPVRSKSCLRPGRGAARRRPGRSRPTRHAVGRSPGDHVELDRRRAAGRCR